MTRILIRAVRATLAWLAEPIHQDRGAREVPLCIDAWLFRHAQPAPDRNYPPKRRTIPLRNAWMVRPC
jgi:hypothetical protein